VDARRCQFTQLAFTNDWNENIHLARHGTALLLLLLHRGPSPVCCFVRMNMAVVPTALVLITADGLEVKRRRG